MPQLNVPTGAEAADDSSFSNAFNLAKQALTYIGTYRTPPTPPIFRLWYHYAEGSDQALHSELTALLERETVEPERLEAIRKQYFPETDNSDLHRQTGDSLASEVAAMQRLLEEQRNAGSDFRQALRANSDSLQQPTPTRDELQACINEVLASNAKMHAKLAETELKLAASQQHIDALRRDLLDSQKAMLTDNLTGIGNRRFFELLMQQALEAFQKGTGIGDRDVLTLIDLDGFKEVNDTLGHSAGDEVLRFAAHEMQRLAGDGSVARLGGDEFGILQRIDSEQASESLGETICDFFSGKKLAIQQSGAKVGRLTASVGVAILRNDDDRQSWFERADNLLYSAKKAGRNRVMSERSIR